VGLTHEPCYLEIMDLRYPIGKFQWPAAIAAEDREKSIAQIAAAPAEFRQAVHGLDDQQLDTPYREGGWTVRQVIHHVPDSHMNSYCRFKFALTENQPGIKGYAEDLWAELADGRTGPIDTSLVLLESLHRRWVILLKSMTDQDFARSFRHSELGLLRLDSTLALYDWHSRHHVAHITSLRQRMGWA
jgi:hypothetical protein